MARTLLNQTCASFRVGQILYARNLREKCELLQEFRVLCVAVSYQWLQMAPALPILMDCLVMHAVSYEYAVWARWIRSGNDAGRYAEVEGDSRIYWADGTSTKHNWLRKRHRENRQKAFNEVLLSSGYTRADSDVLPTKVRFDPREDDSGESAGKDDDLGTAWIDIEQAYTNSGKHEYDGEDLSKEINHRRKKFEFVFGYKLTPKITFNVTK